MVESLLVNRLMFELGRVMKVFWLTLKLVVHVLVVNRLLVLFV